MPLTDAHERPAVAKVPAARGLSAVVVSARPAQWVKNLVVPLPFLFGGALATARGWKLAAAGFIVFCAVTSAIYLVNDVMDRERDRAHPVKKNRPLAAGT
ncbi:MAG TPA: UbiA family prenyltransferase, partial [Thermoanaerobaculia bacterium]